ncbi:hypothetical protein [Aestuariivirga sp.]|uniref:hypothetical protein n=1 Tax=Aestuariivirga sp. TaxID=2650926 RepID=UPI0035936D5C
MRLTLLAAAATLVLASPQALAYENFIPMGQSYSPGVNELPRLDSEQDRLNSQVDIYESEIYNRQRELKEFSTQMNSYSLGQTPSGTSDFIDY